jgi:biopolymer transport protein ExbD
MPKVKVARKSTAIDMTAMCDVAFLLLTFFMLTSNFTQKEPVQVSTPSSVSEIKIPEINIMTILIDKEGKVFFGIDGQEKRIEMLRTVGEVYKISFTDKELKTFSLINSCGIPIGKMKEYLALPQEARDAKENQLGIPTDSLNNQFKDWIIAARKTDVKGKPASKIAIKADRGTSYKVIKAVMSTLQGIDENRYNLITALEQPSDN